MRLWNGDPQTAPDYWQQELRRVTDVNGELLVVYRDQDGDEWAMNAQDFDDWQRFGTIMP
jgi:hypothetical protein